jgi:hypothetical protein
LKASFSTQIQTNLPHFLLGHIHTINFISSEERISDGIPSKRKLKFLIDRPSKRNCTENLENSRGNSIRIRLKILFLEICGDGS